MKTLNVLLEWTVLAVIGLILLSFFEQAMAANAQNQAAANRSNALTSLLYQTGSGILSIPGWNNSNLKYAP